MPLLLFILILFCLIASFLIPWWRTDAIKKELEEENARLKRMYANLAMELDVAKYIIEKKF